MRNLLSYLFLTAFGLWLAYHLFMLIQLGTYEIRESNRWISIPELLIVLLTVLLGIERTINWIKHHKEVQ